MKYLSFDIEATGLEKHDLIIEFAMIPFCAKTREFNEDLKKHFFINKIRKNNKSKRKIAI